MVLCSKYVNIANMSFINNKNDDYYTVSNDTSILSDEPIVNYKPGKTHNGFTKFMIIMLAIVIWVLLTCIIFCPVVIVAYYNQNNISGLAHIMCPIIFGLVLLFMFMSNKVIIIASNIFDKLENNAANDTTANSETKKDDTLIEDKNTANDSMSYNDQMKQMGVAVSIVFAFLMILVMFTGM